MHKIHSWIVMFEFAYCTYFKTALLSFCFCWISVENHRIFTQVVNCLQQQTLFHLSALTRTRCEPSSSSSEKKNIISCYSIDCKKERESFHIEVRIRFSRLNYCGVGKELVDHLLCEWLNVVLQNKTSVLPRLCCVVDLTSDNTLGALLYSSVFGFELRSVLMSENADPSDSTQLRETRLWGLLSVVHSKLTPLFVVVAFTPSFHPWWTPAKNYPPIAPNYISICRTGCRVAAVGWFKRT